MKEKKLPEKPIENNCNEEPTVLKETICSLILDTIISKVITTVNTKEIYSNLNEHCFNFMLDKLNPYLKTNFLFHENNENFSNIPHCILFANILPQKKNTWVSLPEPGSSKIDRYDFTKSKIINFESEILIIKNKISSKNVINQIDENKTENNKKVVSQYLFRKDNKLNSMRESLEFGEKSVDEIKKPKKIIKIIKENKIEEENINYNVNVKKNKKDQILEDLSFFDLPEERYKNVYVEINGNEENNKLRVERERQKILLEEQKKIDETNSKEEKVKNMRVKLKNKKEFNSDKMTFDPNGKIIYIKSPAIENFQYNDFFFLKQTVNDKTLNNENNNSPKKENIKQKANKKNSKILNIENKIENIKIEYNPENEETPEEKKYKKYIRSYQNPDKIIPEIGVIIHKDKEKKEGGFDYMKKYNKPSINEFSKIVQENSQYNSISLTTSNNINEPKNNYLTEPDNYNGYLQEFNENNNPLIQGAHKLNNNIYNLTKSSESMINSINNEIDNKRMVKNKSAFTKDIILINRNLTKSLDLLPNIKNKNLNSINLSKNILLSKNVHAPNLLNYFDRNDITEKYKVNNKQTNLQPLRNYIIKNKSTDNYQIKSSKQTKMLPLIKIKDFNNMENNIKFFNKESIDNFNMNILKNKNWGLDDDDKDNKLQNRLKNNIFRRPVKTNKNIFEGNGYFNQRERALKIDIGKL